MSDSEWMMVTMVLGIMVLFVSVLLCFLFALLSSVFSKEDKKSECVKKTVITKPLINSPLEPTLKLPTERKEPSSGTVTVEMESVLSDGLDDWSDSLSDNSSNSSNISTRSIFGQKTPSISSMSSASLPLPAVVPAFQRLALPPAVPQMTSLIPQIEKTPLLAQKSPAETIVEMEEPTVIPTLPKTSTMFPTAKPIQTAKPISVEKPTNQMIPKKLPVKSLGLVDIPLNGNQAPIVRRSVVSTGTPDKRVWLPYALPSAVHRSVFADRNEMSPKRESETAAERPISAKPTRR